MPRTGLTPSEVLALLTLSLPLLGLALPTLGCTGDEEEEAVVFTDAERGRIFAATPAPAAQPDPTNAWADDPDAAVLGQRLYFDERLSEDGSVACATCHDPALGFGDDLELAEGMGTTGKHSPTVWNTADNRWFFWDGRADSHWAQALGPLESEVEHGSSRLALAHLIFEDATLSAEYEALFGPLPPLDDAARFPPEGRPVPEDPEHPHALAWAEMDEADQDAVTEVFVNLGKSIAAYERLLMSGESDFDRFAAQLEAGDSADPALSSSAQRGLKLFMGEARCHFCHAGPNLSDREFHNIGLGPRDYLDPEDTGRYDGIAALLANPFNGMGPWSDDAEAGALKIGALVVDDYEQTGQYKTPGLRNVALHPPYMHGGHFKNLEEVVHHYDLLEERPAIGHREELLLPLELEMQEVMDLVAFMESLTGDGPDPALLEPLQE